MNLTTSEETADSQKHKNLPTKTCTLSIRADQRTIEFEATFGLEIGFGMGEQFVEWAVRPDAWHLIGVELYKPVSAQCYRKPIS